MTIDSSGRLFELFSIAAPEWGVTEVADELGVSKSKAHALLASLTAVGLLRRTPRGRYRLGWRLLELNRVLADTTDFRCQAHPVLKALCAHFGDTAQLATLDDDRVVYLDRIKGEHAASMPFSQIGATMPAHCTAVGKVMLAHLPGAELDGLMARSDFAPITERTITRPDDLREEIARVRHRGLAIDDGEAVPGLSSIAAPVRGVGCETVAAIGISAPTERVESRRPTLEAAVLRAGDYVSRRLRAATRDPYAREAERPAQSTAMS